MVLYYSVVLTVLILPFCQSALIWQEEFDNLNEDTWHHLVTTWRGGNNEFQYYTNNRTNSYVTDGILYIKPSLTADRFGEDFLYYGTLDLTGEGCDFDCVVTGNPDGEIVNPIQSARLLTDRSFSFTYGRVEVRAKMPSGDWMWPAIWLLPTDMVYGDWPASGEIDIVESRGNERLLNGPEGDRVDNTYMGSTLHWGPYYPINGYEKTHWERRLEDGSSYADDFHLYELIWTDSNITFNVDGTFLGSVTPPPGGFWELGGFQGQNVWENGTIMAPFDQDFHFILNVAIGGAFFSTGMENGETPDVCEIPWQMESGIAMRQFWEARDCWLPTWNMEYDDGALQIDYIRVYDE